MPRACAAGHSWGQRRPRRPAGGGARDGVEPAGLLARVRRLLAVQPRHGELQVLHRGAVPDGVPLHVQGQVLPCALQLASYLDQSHERHQRAVSCHAFQLIPRSLACKAVTLVLFTS